jgi:maltose alpha-D-glucosyltransferase/alpha-amylase
LARIWGGRARVCFLEGYGEGAGGASSYPEEDEHTRTLLDLFLLEAALREVDRELENRPERSGDPIRGLIQLLDPKTAEGRT